MAFNIWMEWRDARVGNGCRCLRNSCWLDLSALRFVPGHARRALRAENAKRDKLMTEKSDAEIRAMYTEQELLDLGDKSPFYRYTV